MSICSVLKAVPTANAFVRLNGIISSFNIWEEKELFEEFQANVTSTIDAYLTHFGNTVIRNEETEEIEIANGTTSTIVAPGYVDETPIKAEPLSKKGKLIGKMNVLKNGKKATFKKVQEKNGLKSTFQKFTSLFKRKKGPQAKKKYKKLESLSDDETAQLI